MEEKLEHELKVRAQMRQRRNAWRCLKRTKSTEIIILLYIL